MLSPRLVTETDAPATFPALIGFSTMASMAEEAGLEMRRLPGLPGDSRQSARCGDARADDRRHDERSIGSCDASGHEDAPILICCPARRPCWSESIDSCGNWPRSL